MWVQCWMLFKLSWTTSWRMDEIAEDPCSHEEIGEGSICQGLMTFLDEWNIEPVIIQWGVQAPTSPGPFMQGFTAHSVHGQFDLFPRVHEIACYRQTSFFYIAFSRSKRWWVVPIWWTLHNQRKTGPIWCMDQSTCFFDPALCRGWGGHSWWMEFKQEATEWVYKAGFSRFG